MRRAGFTEGQMRLVCQRSMLTFDDATTYYQAYNWRVARVDHPYEVGAFTRSMNSDDPHFVQYEEILRHPDGDIQFGFAYLL
jgi:hypothetical protein